MLLLGWLSCDTAKTWLQIRQYCRNAQQILPEKYEDTASLLPDRVFDFGRGLAALSVIGSVLW